MNHLSNEQINAVIEELESDISLLKRAYDVTRLNQTTENFTKYEGRKEVYQSVIELFEGITKEYKIELLDREERTSK